MKKIVIKTLILAGLFMVFAFSSTAQTVKRSVDERQINQSKRIANGLYGGELTRNETRQLVRQQKDIQRTKRKARADGKVTITERAIIQKKQNQASRNIKRKKHNSIER